MPAPRTYRPLRPLRLLRLSLVSLFVCLSSTLASAQTSAWEVLEDGQTLSFVDRSSPVVVARPAAGESAWAAVRAASSWDGSSAAYTGRSILTAVPALLDMKHQHLLGWESYLIAAHEQLGNIDARVAAEWIRLFNEADRLSDDTFVRRLFRLRQYDRGSALAVYPPECVPLDLAVLSAAEVVTAIETSIPARRTLDMSETVRVPVEVVATLERSERSEFVQAVDYAINGASFSGRIWPRAQRRLDNDQAQSALGGDPTVSSGAQASPGEGTTASPAADRDERAVVDTDDERGSEAPGACNPLDVALVAELGWLTRHRWNRLEQRISEISARSWIPSKLYWRAAVHQYLQTNQEALATIGALYAAAYPESEPGIRFMEALVDLVDGSIHAERASWPRRSEATNTTWLWVYAEHLRFRWQLEDAAELARLLIDQDAQFLGAWLTQTAIALRRGDMVTVRTNLAHLAAASPPDSVYAHWTTQLEQQLAEGAAVGSVE